MGLPVAALTDCGLGARSGADPAWIVEDLVGVLSEAGRGTVGHEGSAVKKDR
jgi:hypothetical protein